MHLHFLAVDDEPLALSDLVNALKDAEPNCALSAFSEPDSALSELAAGRIHPDIAFLDIQMRAWSGLQFAAEIRKVCPSIEIIFVTAHPQYALESYALHVRGYLLKPVTVEAIQEELRNIGPLPLRHKGKQGLQVQCFGNFEIFYQGRPLEFSRSKSKELLAYLIYRNGASCSTREIAGILFEDRQYDRSVKNQIETFKSDLNKTLKALHHGDIIEKSHNQLSIIPHKLDCDYYRYLQGDRLAIHSFTGEFMAQYSWAEVETASLHTSEDNL